MRPLLACSLGNFSLVRAASWLVKTSPLFFRAFPRRYAKTEMYGTGLMDMGVGGMMVAGGMVSRTTKVPAASRSL
eukprot:1154968-Pelagomonas_calceolata.AAC.8